MWLGDGWAPATMNVEILGDFLDSFSRVSWKLKMLPSFLRKTVVAWRKVSCFFRLLLPHVNTFTIYNVLFRAPRCSKKRCKKHAPCLDQARFIFAWLVLFSRCPYYLSALQRLVNNALMFLKKHTRMHSLSRSSERILIWCSCGTKAEIFQLSRATAN